MWPRFPSDSETDIHVEYFDPLMSTASPNVTTSRRGIFPLHMTPFETYMWVDDSPRYPMTFVIEMELAGKMDRERMQRAVDQSLHRHPLLRSCIRPAKSNRDCWVHTENYDSRIRWREAGQTIQVSGAGAFIDLRNEIGVKIWGVQRGESSRLTFAFHHTATDGIGAYQFLGDMLWFYADANGTELPPLVALDPNVVRRRLQATVSREMLSEVSGLKERLVHECAQPLVGSRDGESVEQHEFPRFFEHVFDKAKYRELRLVAQDAGQSVNDRLVKGLLITLATWNEMHDVAGDRSYCINMPMDLRTNVGPEIPAANIVTCAFIRRTQDQIRDRDELDRFLREESVRVKATRYSSHFMKLLVQSPVDLATAAHSYASEDCLATAIFSNTGDPTRRFLTPLPRVGGLVQAGDLTLVDVSGVSPLRDKTRLAVGIFTYKRELKLCIRTDPFHFSSDDSQQLLDMYVKSIWEQ